MSEMNYMNQIAHMLGVELDEEFYLEDITDGCYVSYDEVKAVFKLSNSGVLRKDKHIVNGWIGLTHHYLPGLLTGRYTIVKKPWKPKRDEKYYYVSLLKRIYQTCFYKDNNDVMRYQLGNCFRTEEEITPEVLEETWRRCYGKYIEEEE